MLGLGDDTKRQFNEEMSQRRDEADMGMAQQMFDPRKVAMDSQVSALLLEIESRFLKYKIDYERNQLVCTEKYKYLEPWGEEAKCFLEGTKPGIIGEIDMLLAETYAFSEKYDESMINVFNEVVRVRFSLLNLSRATGKAAKLAKSQFVESTAQIRRDLVGQNKKSGGLFGLGLGPL